MITIEFANLHVILQSGSPLYRKYLARKKQQAATDSDVAIKDESAALQMQKEAMRNLHIIELLDNNSSFRKLSAVQKRHLESLAEGPVYYAPGQRLWLSGQSVDKAFIIVAGTVAFVPKRRNAHAAASVATDMPPPNAMHASSASNNIHSVSRDEGRHVEKGITLGDEMRMDAMKAMKELHDLDMVSKCC